VTLITAGHVPDKIHEDVRPHFSEKELSDLTLAVAAAITPGIVSGAYLPAKSGVTFVRILVGFATLALVPGSRRPVPRAATFLIPAVALVLGIVVRGERVALLSVIGGAVCVAGAWLMRRAQMEPTRVAGT
jgi:hypothetical protein